MQKKNRIVIFASGSGSNALNIIEYFKDSTTVEVILILSNNPKAGVLNHAKNHNIPYLVFDKSTFNTSVVDQLIDLKIDLIVLAGFLWLIPARYTDIFKGKIINIHPSLLPKYGGKGMYGLNVHKAVKNNNESQTGITIHYVNENFDEGEIIAQYSCEIEQNYTAKEIAEKVLQLEHKYFPIVIDKILLDKQVE